MLSSPRTKSHEAGICVDDISPGCGARRLQAGVLKRPYAVLLSGRGKKRGFALSVNGNRSALSITEEFNPPRNALSCPLDNSRTRRGWAVPTTVVALILAFDLAHELPQ